MTPEDRELLRRNVALSEENNDMLRGIQSSLRLSRFISTVYWVVIIGSAIGAFYFVKPYIQQAEDIYGGVKSNWNSIVGTFGKKPNEDLTN